MATKLAQKNTSQVIMGGASQVTFFKLLKDTDGAYQVVTPTATSETMTAASAVTDNVFAAQLVESLNITYTEEGTITSTITNLEDSEALETFLETYAHTGVVASTDDATTHTLEDGTVIGGSSAGITGTPLLMVASGGLNTSTDKRKVTCAVVTVNVTSGGWETSASEYNQPTLELTGHTLSADLVIPEEVLDARLYSIATGTDITITANRPCKVAFRTKGDGTYPA